MRKEAKTMICIEISLIGMIIGWFSSGYLCKVLRPEIPQSLLKNILFGMINSGLFSVVYYYFGLSITAIAYALLGSILLLIVQIDYYTMRIPNQLIIFGVIAGVLYLIALSIHYQKVQIMLHGMMGMLVGAGIIGGMMLFSLLVFRKEGMGMGDLKLLGMIGLYIGGRYTLYTIFIAIMVGGCYGTVMFLRKRQEMIAFGPFISLGAMITILWGDMLWDLYLNYMI